MGDQVFYFRGQFPADVTLVTPAFVEDAKILLKLDADQIRRIADTLEETPGFLDRETLQALLGEILKGKEHCRRLALLLGGLHSRFRQFGLDLDWLVAQIEKWLESKENREKQLLSREDFEILRERLPLVIKPYPGLDRQAKAERLSHATGLPLEDVQMICDLRPVFDDKRENVEGMLPYTTLKVVCKDVDGLPVSMEATLSRKQVSELAEMSKAAERKLDALTALLAQKEVRIPAIGLTRQEPSS